MPNRMSGNFPDMLSLAAEYTTPYSALVRENVVMGVPRYFLERWVPVLGTNPATVVNTLRQLNYRTQTGTVTISGAALAREAAMSRRHLYTCLDSPWLTAFLRLHSGERTRNHEGKIVQKANQYFIRMDDPLIPADADHLVTVLGNLGDTPIEAAERALEHPPQELWAPNLSKETTLFTHPRAIQALDVIQRAFPTWQPTSEQEKETLAQVAEQLHRHVTLVNATGRVSKIIVPQYFRQNWWSKLGHDLAWAYLWLRAHVYIDTGTAEQRNVCWIPALQSVLDVIGRPREWWRRNVENRPNDEGWNLSDFFEQIDTQKGRDPAQPQWVARQFRVTLTIPIAPEDRAQYASFLKAWPDQEVSQQRLPASSTNEHTGADEVCHKQTHRSQQGPPQTDTTATHPSATNKHNGNTGVRHKQTQTSATNEHRESQFQNSALEKIPVPSNSNKQEGANNSIPKNSGDGGKNPAESALKLFELLVLTMEKEPHTSLFEAAESALWLQQAWPEPVHPHTPIWTLVAQNQICRQDLVALILAIWGNSTIKHPPRYLSWIAQRWQMLPDTPPFEQWEKWQALSALPIGKWPTEGRRLWIEVADRHRRMLPFGLDVLVGEIQVTQYAEVPGGPGNDVVETTPLARNLQLARSGSNGLDTCPGDGRLTMSDIWRATLGELGSRLNRSTYVNWVEGAKAVSYADGVLIVRARHQLARDWLAQRLNHSIEETASVLAGIPIKISYIAES